ncbi:MAG: GNAT family N-acetyltransferase, partial [Promethearchaeota archaeon]
DLYVLLERCFIGSAEDKRFYKLHFMRPYDDPDWEYSRVGLIDKRLVSHVSIWRFNLHLSGGFILSGGGIRDVCTDPDFRKKGYGHRVLADAINFMKEKKIEMSALYAGPRRFYAAKGFMAVMPSYMFKLNLGESCNEQSGKISDDPIYLDELKSFSREIARRLHEIRESTNINLDFVVARDPGYFSRLIESVFKFPNGSERIYLVRERDTGNIAGYLYLEIDKQDNGPSNVVLKEARVLHENQELIFDRILTLLNDLWPGASLSIKLSPNHDICRMAIKRGAKNNSTLISGLMIEIFDLRSFLTKLIAALNYKIKSGFISARSLNIVPATSFSLRILDNDDNTLGVFNVNITSDDLEMPVKIQPLNNDDFEDIGNGNVVMTKEMMLTMLFSPILTVEEAVEDEMMEVSGVSLDAIELLFSHFTWDKESWDYF